MSAFVVSKEHIDAIVAVAVRGPSGTVGNSGPAGTVWHGIRWDRNPELNSIEDARWGRAEHSDADRIGAMLWSENVNSVEGRYPDTIESGDYPGDIGFGVLDVAAYSWPFTTPRLSPVEALKALDCYEYQSCEHDGWDSSEAFRFCDSLRRSLIGSLPGYSEAAWSVMS